MIKINAYIILIGKQQLERTGSDGRLFLKRMLNK
jgi:hypothetical protein